MSLIEDTLVIMPAYNEEKAIGAVIENLKKIGLLDILVVDDGSSDRTSQLSKEKGAFVIEHFVNVGVGGATTTGFEYARKSKFRYVVTVDADGQHMPSDVLKVVHEIRKERADIVIGSRLKSLKKRHKIRYIINILSNFFTFALSGRYVSDTQSGLRSYNKKSLGKLKLESSGYEICSEIVYKAISAKLRIKEVDINAVYTNYSIAKGQRLTNSIRIVMKLLIQKYQL